MGPFRVDVCKRVFCHLWGWLEAVSFVGYAVDEHLTPHEAGLEVLFFVLCKTFQGHWTPITMGGLTKHVWKDPATEGNVSFRQKP